MENPLRTEKKFPLTLKQFYLFKAWHKNHGNHLKKVFPDRFVNSVYFDTPDFHDYYHNVEGFGKRQKTRLRWYGEMENPPCYRFEIKRRINTFTCKAHQEISSHKIKIPPLKTLFPRLRALLKPDLKCKTSTMFIPTVYSRYYREYYAYHNHVRLTVDTDLRFATLFHKQHIITPLRKCQISAVIELKYSHPPDPDIYELLRTFPFRNTRNSKYANAITGI